MIFWRLLIALYLINGISYTRANELISKRAIVIGASMGMGKRVAELLATEGYIVGMAARKIDLLEKNQQQISTPTVIAQMDASKPEESVEILNAMIEKMGGLDLLVIAITGYQDADFKALNWEKTFSVIQVDVAGFYALSKAAFLFFEQQGYGHLVGFSSIDGLRGVATTPVYSAAKAFASRYMEAERNKYMQRNVPIYVTDIMPGWVNSREDIDCNKLPNAYWVENLEDASREIMEAIKNKVSVAYITKRWQKVAELLPLIPEDLYNALCARPGGAL